MKMINPVTAAGFKVPWFSLFKYTVYALLTVNLVLFFLQDAEASTHIFTDGITFSQLIEAYATTIDTAFWIMLLYIFELETWVISDSRLKGSLKWWLNGVKGICYVVLCYALYGYFAKYLAMQGFDAAAFTNLCSQVGDKLSFMTALDEFEVVSAQNCGTLSSANTFFQVPDSTMVTDREALESATWFALIDVVNATAWLLVVSILTLDVLWQMRGKFDGVTLRVSAVIKVVLYFILLVAAILWGVDGDFLDFWDAFMWILAFAFIEMNLFEWLAESKGKHLAIGAETMKH